jgi:hypothetical protein
MKTFVTLFNKCFLVFYSCWNHFKLNQMFPWYIIIFFVKVHQTFSTLISFTTLKCEKLNNGYALYRSWPLQTSRGIVVPFSKHQSSMSDAQWSLYCNCTHIFILIVNFNDDAWVQRNVIIGYFQAPNIVRATFAKLVKPLLM